MDICLNDHLYFAHKQRDRAKLLCFAVRAANNCCWASASYVRSTFVKRMMGAVELSMLN